MPIYPSPETWIHANERQAQRARRSFAELKERAVPAFAGPLFGDDDNEARIQPADEVARRALILWGVALRGEGAPLFDILSLIEQLDLWKSVSPSEKTFLLNEDPPPEQSQRLVWRLECIWVLMWVLGFIDQLEWPSSMCDARLLASLMCPLEADFAFITSAHLRSTSEILSAQDLIMRILLAIRDAYLHHNGMIPEDLDWSRRESYVSVHQSAAVCVVQERHRTPNWLINFMDPKDWDNVDTST